MLDAWIPMIAEQAAGPAQGTRLFDWWTFVFQIVNFLILVFLLRYFLYGRVVRAMDQREKKIASHFEAAEQKAAEATASAEAAAREKAELAAKREALLQAARDETARHRQELTDKAREEVGRQAARWHEDLEREKEAFLQEMQQRAGKQVCDVARRALADLADADLERRMAAVLAGRLKDLSDADRRELAEALRASGGNLAVATAWELPAEDRDRVARAVHEDVSQEASVAFETDAAVGCGIELRAAGRKVAWTIEGYLQGIREHLAAAIDERIADVRARAETREKAAGADRAAGKDAPPARGGNGGQGRADG